jgi:hypothetical protein
MSANIERMPNTAPSFAGEAREVIMNGALSAGIGFICAKMSKTNVVAAVIIGGCQGLTEATFGKVVKHCLGEEARSAKLVLAVGNCVIGTIVTIASVAFGVLSMSGGVIMGVFVFGTLGWHLFSAIKPEQAEAFTSKLLSSCFPKLEQHEVAEEDQVRQDQAESTEESIKIDNKLSNLMDGEFLDIDLNDDGYTLQTPSRTSSKFDTVDFPTNSLTLDELRKLVTVAVGSN